MAHYQPLDTDDGAVPAGLRRFLRFRALESGGLGLVALAGVIATAIATWSVDDPSLNHAIDSAPKNWLGYPGAVLADEAMQLLGLSSIAAVALLMAWAVRLLSHQGFDRPVKQLLAGLASVVTAAGALSCLPAPARWAIGSGLGGNAGDILSGAVFTLLAPFLRGGPAAFAVFMLFGGLTLWGFLTGTGIPRQHISALFRRGLDRVRDSVINTAGAIEHMILSRRAAAQKKAKSNKKPAPGVWQRISALFAPQPVKARTASPRSRVEPMLDRSTAPAEPRLKLPPVADGEDEHAETGDAGEFEQDLQDQDEALEQGYAVNEEQEADETPAPALKVTRSRKDIKPSAQAKVVAAEHFEMPPVELLSEPKRIARGADISDEALEANARALEGVLDDFGVKGQIINVRPGPVVTLYELEPAPGIKSSRVIGLADDIARSMSAISARVAVVPGRNAIGIELPNAKRETVFLRELLGSEAFAKTNQNLALALGKNIGGEPVFADLARMPHLLIAGTTGSGKSVGINTMILSLLYRLPPQRCKLIMIDPKMLELSVYEGIPHLLAPVVTDPRKAVVALKWAVREMEDRYRKMSKVNVRNIDGYNARVKQALAKGEGLSRTVQTGFDPASGEPVFEKEAMDAEPLPYIVVLIDEMADLMMVAGKDIEGAVQRLAQMARAAGIHVIMATQRPSVDVITGTIKANFPTRISFQVTSKIDSRTILGEQGAEQLLGQGDMLYMAGGGRISRLHAPFVTDDEVESIVKHLKLQGAPDYVDAVTEEDEDAEYGEPGATAGVDGASGGSGDDLYDQAVAVVLRDKKVSTSYIQRRLQVGYNKAASLIERMEKEGVISSANSTGKREILVPGDSARD